MGSVKISNRREGQEEGDMASLYLRLATAASDTISLLYHCSCVVFLADDLWYLKTRGRRVHFGKGFVKNGTTRLRVCGRKNEGLNASCGKG
jgi:hypothetical protein